MKKVKNKRAKKHKERAKIKKRIIKRKKNIFSIFTQLQTYLNIIYLLLLFPLGIASFVIVVTLLALSLGFIVSPIVAPFGAMMIGNIVITAIHLKILVSLILFILGIFLLIASFYIINGLSWLFKKLLGIFNE